MLPYNHQALALHAPALQSTTVRLACAQLGPVLGDLSGNRDRADAAIRRAAAEGARIVVLPELCTSGYAFDDEPAARSCAEPADGPSVERWTALAVAHDLVVVAGLCERHPDGRLRNTAVVVDAGGLRDVYRKTHLWDREPDLFTAGDAPAPVVDTARGRIGLAVCYDSAFPEHMRRLALLGADIVAIPMNSPAPDAPTQPVPIELAIAMAAANANRVWIAQADRTGEERGTRWAEASAIVDPDGSIVAGPIAGAGLVVADVDIARARDKAWGPRNHVLGDRREDLYASSPPSTEEFGTA
jgi:predicted amidohydrolase